MVLRRGCARGLGREFAVYERAEDRIRQQRGRRLSRNQVLTELAKRVLAGADGTARARLPVVVRVDGPTGRGWYETRRGLLSATAEEVERALTDRNRGRPQSVRPA